MARGPVPSALRTALGALAALLLAAQAHAVHEGGTTVVLSTFENGQALGKPAVNSSGNGVVHIIGDTVVAAPAVRLYLEAQVGGLTGPALAAHFHGPAWFGQEASVIVPLSTGITGTYDVTAEQWALMVAGRTYINVHTPAYPNGEIRGHVCFSNCGFAELTGEGLVPPANTPAYGVAQIVFAPATGAVVVAHLQLYGDDAWTSAAVYAGATAGGVGSAVCTVPVPASSAAPCVAPGAGSPGQQAAAQAGGWYVQAATAGAPAGLLRGQFVFPANLTHERYWTASLAGAGERPTPTDSPATGVCQVFGLAGQVTRDAPSRFVAFVTFTALTAPQVGAHIHAPATANQTAPIVVPFPRRGPFAYFAFLGPPLVTNSLEDGLAYTNVHSTRFPAGEIRGQLRAVVADAAAASEPDDGATASDGGSDSGSDGNWSDVSDSAGADGVAAAEEPALGPSASDASGPTPDVSSDAAWDAQEAEMALADAARAVEDGVASVAGSGDLHVVL